MANQTLQQGKYYHIFNRSIDDNNLFNEPANYEKFLSLYEKYIFPVADTFAWVLMPDHFHILVRIRENIAYKNTKEFCNKKSLNFDEIKWQTMEMQKIKGLTDGLISNQNPYNNSDPYNRNTIKENYLRIPKAYLHFSHLCNAYSKYFNKNTKRQGSLFERPFKRKFVNNVNYLKQLIIYIHNNPVHHGFCDHAAEYPWSSYLSIISIKPTLLKRNEIIGWFDDAANFKSMHANRQDVSALSKWLDLG